MYIPCRILTAPVGRVWRLTVFSRCYAPKNTIRLSPYSGGKLTLREKYSFYYLYALDDILCRILR